jgi:hypothetical protein
MNKKGQEKPISSTSQNGPQANINVDVSTNFSLIIEIFFSCPSR